MKWYSKIYDISGMMRISNSSHVLSEVCCRAHNTQARPERSRRDARRNTREKAFSLPEVVAALAVLALVSSSVLVVINRSVASTANSMLRMQAFEIARENMETLLSKNSAREMDEYGYSDRYPEIQWRTTVESFYEPITSRMWVQAICSAEYTDTQGEVQKVELTHWLTDLSKRELLELIEEKEKEKERLARQSETEQQGQGEQEEPEELILTPENLREKGFSEDLIEKILPLLENN